MSEVEKLRSLLADVRRMLGEPCKVEFCGDSFCEVVRYIDNSLEKPIVLTQSELDRMLAEAKQQGARECPHHRIDAGVMIRAIREAEGKAFTRGAEAMREAAARCVVESARYWSAQYVADDIRALPVPEDKP